MRNEIWKGIEGYEGQFEISIMGKIRSMYDSRGKSRILIRKVHISKDGYYSLCLTRKMARRTFKVHILFAKAFIPNPENKKCINHKDGNKLNNDISNLEWCTHEENLIHAHRLGLINKKGVDNSNVKLTNADVVEIRKSTIETRYLAKTFNVSSSQIRRIRNGKRWKQS